MSSSLSAGKSSQVWEESDHAPVQEYRPQGLRNLTSLQWDVVRAMMSGWLLGATVQQQYTLQLTYTAHTVWLLRSCIEEACLW